MKLNSLKILTLFFVLFSYQTIFSQIPAGYYNGTDGLTGDELRNALRSIISNGHTSNSYNSLEDDFYYTDNLGSNKVWDMYSMDATGNAAYYFYYNISGDQCGSYNGEGDCFNKEHSFPKSWWGGGSAIQYSDLFHLVPTDGYVNNKRSNFPFGEVDAPTWTSTNGSKLGPNSFPGYSGTVFEPVDAYKGDFARNYFYMATRYMNSFSSWNSPMLSGNNFAPWAINLLLAWDELDPVSTKEIDRNNAVYLRQNNRNPYIDHPEWTCIVFGQDCGNNVPNPTNFTATGTSASQINLTWNLNPNSNIVVLAYNSENTFGTPTGTYTAGQVITNGGTVLYVGTNLSFNHTGLQAQNYYYKIWSYDLTNYSSGISKMASPFKPEPSNHASSFIATGATASSIDLTWTDATGSVLPQGYLIKANYSAAAITNPTDGQPENDGTFTKNVSFGDQTAIFDNLIQTTHYFFKIFPYTNSGANIDYKTDGIIPQTDEFTTVLPQYCVNETFDNVPASGSYINISWTGNDGGTWNATSARTDVQMTGKSVCFKGYVLSPIMPNGIESLTITTNYPYSDGTSVLNIEVNGTNIGTVPIANGITQTSTISGINISGNMQVKILSDGTKRAAIDDLQWSCNGTIPVNDSNTEIYEPTSQTATGTILNTNTSFVEVFKFKIQDVGTSDGLSTFISQMKFFVKSPENTANWTNSISDVTISCDNVNLSIGTLNIGDNFIHAILNQNFELADNTSKEFVLSVKLKSETVVNQSVLKFSIDADNHEFIANAAGSTFAPVVNMGNDIISNPFTILVEGINDMDTEIFEPTIQVAATTINNDNILFTNVLKYAVEDLGTADGLPTLISEMKFYPKNPDNTAIWTNTISDIQISNNNNVLETSSVNITDGYIQAILISNFEVADNTNQEFTLSVKLKNETVIDESILKFKIIAYNHGFMTDEAGSGFAQYINQSNDIISNSFRIVDPTNGINKFNSNSVYVYPNPSENGIFSINISDLNNSFIDIYDICGRIVYSNIITENEKIIDLSFAKNGIYFANIKNQNQNIFTKIVINK